MRPALVALVVALLSPALVSAGPVEDAERSASEAPAAACPAECYQRTEADRADEEPLAYFRFRHARDADARQDGRSFSGASRVDERFVVPLVFVASGARASDDRWSGGLATTRSLHLLAAGAPGVIVLDAGRAYDARETGSSGAQSDDGRAGASASTTLVTTRGGAAYARQARYDSTYDRSTETLVVERDVQLANGQPQRVKLELTLASDHVRGVATLTLKGNVTGRLVEQSVLLPLDLP